MLGKAYRWLAYRFEDNLQSWRMAPFTLKMTVILIFGVLGILGTLLLGHAAVVLSR